MPLTSTFIESIANDQPQGSRRELLGELKTYLKQRISHSGEVCLHFICTHNSRRSQFSQAWSHVWSHHFSLPLHSYSAGVEATEVHPNVLKALAIDGLQIRSRKTEIGVKHVLEEGNTFLPLYSKHMDDVRMECASFVAIMTCSEADADCPFIPGADLRIPLRYDDPKKYDHQAGALDGYLASSRRIAAELYYAFNLEADD